MGKRIQKIKQINKEGTGFLKLVVLDKIFKVKEDKRYIMLIILELLLVCVLAASIYLYLDPEVNYVPFPYNYISFILILVGFLWLYTKTKPFRIEIKQN